MAKMLKIVLPLWLVLGMLPLRAQQWQSVDDASLSERERVHLSDYEVSIRTRDGHWQQVKVAGALVSNIDKRGEDGDRGINGTDTAGHARTLMGVAMLTHDFAQKGDRGVRVRVKRRGVPFSEVTIRPTAKRIKPRRIDGQTVEFSLDHPAKVSVEFDGDRDHNLFVFADTPLERPAQDDLIYFGPGEHEAGFINMHSGQTVFIDEGAVVYGQIDARGADHIRILGRGILCGSQAVHDFQRRRSMIYCSRCRDVRVEGVLFRGSPSWTLCFSDCDSVLLDNIKEICWMRNSDGIDLCNSTNVTIRNAFLRNYDDNISLKNYDVPSGRSTSHVKMLDCTLWADCAHNIVVGPENRPALPMENVSFENIDVLEARETAYPWRGAIGVMGSDDGTFRNILFRNIRIDNVRGGQPFAVEFCRYKSMGQKVENVLLERISIEGDTLGMPRSTVKGLNEAHCIEGFQLRDLRINGKNVKQKEMERHIETNEFVRPHIFSEE